MSNPLHLGDQVPADGIFVSGGEEVACDESAMTGEPDQKSKVLICRFLFLFVR